MGEGGGERKGGEGGMGGGREGRGGEGERKGVLDIRIFKYFLIRPFRVSVHPSIDHCMRTSPSAFTKPKSIGQKY